MVRTVTSQTRARLLASVVIAGLASACSSDIARFNDPFANPFSSRAAFDPVTTASVNKARQSGQTGTQRPIAGIRNTAAATTQPLPAPSQPMLRAATAPAPTRAAVAAAAPVASGVRNTGSVGSANYPVLSPVPARAPTVLGASNGWTAVGGTPVTLQPGESVNTLSSRYGVPASAIMAVNGLSSVNQAQPGQQLVIPAYNAVQASGQPVAPAPVARVANNSPMQALPRASDAAAPQILPRASAPKVETDAEKRAAAKLNDLRKKEADAAKAATPLTKSAAQLKAEKDKAEAAAKAKADASRKLEAQKLEAQKLVDAKKAAELKAAEASKAEALKKAEAAKKAAAASAAAAARKSADVETTASIPEQKALPRTPEKKPEPQQEEASEASFRWPAQGRVIAGFGARGTGGANDGINIALPEGTPVRAAEGGTVVHADDALKGFGKLVLVRHANGYVTVYAHNGELKVKRGESVKRGQVIATSGQSGNVTSPQLHFEIRKGATPVDPMKYLASN